MPHECLEAKHHVKDDLNIMVTMESTNFLLDAKKVSIIDSAWDYVNFSNMERRRVIRHLHVEDIKPVKN